MFLLKCIYLPNPLTTDRMWHKVIFKMASAGSNLEFFLLERLPKQS